MKTKVGSLSVIICFIIVVFFCILACDNGSVSDSSSAAKSNGLVKVSLSVGEKTSSGLQKSISVSSDIVIGSLIYKYNAVPQWVGSRIYGAADWTTINYSDGMSLGYFTPGLWKFGVRLIKIVDGNEVIVYEGYSGVESISTSSVAINIAISKIVEQAAKSVTISVTAPTVDGEALNISYTGTASSVQPIPANITGRANGLTTFEYSFSEETVALDSGNYTFTLNHPLGGSGSAVAVDLRPGEQVQITGHLDNGVWQVGAVTVKIHTIDVTTNVELCSVYANTVSAAAGERVSFYLIPYDGAILKDGTTISVTYVSNPETKVTPLNQDGGMYTFIMPDADVAVNAEYEGVSEDIPIPHFRAMFQILYDSTIKTFGHEDTVPSQGVELFRIKYMTLWKSGTKICWHAGSPTGKVKFAEGSMKNLFKDCSTFTNIDLTGFDTSQVNNMSGMFENCTNLVSVDLSGLDTHEVTSMAGMFRGCEGLTEIVLDTEKDANGKFLHFNTANVTDMSYMFCSKTVEAGNVKPSAMNLTTLDVSGLDTSSVTNMSYMFYMCYQLAALDVSGFDTADVTDMSYMFACYNVNPVSYPGHLTSLNLHGWNFTNVTTVAHLFDRQENLASFSFPETTNFANLTTMTYMFSHCLSLTPETFTDIVATWTFAGQGPNFKKDIYGIEHDHPETTMFGNCNDTNTGDAGRNYIFRSTMTSNGGGDDRNGKFSTRKHGNTYIEYRTKDDVPLYIGGGNKNRHGKLTTVKEP